MNRILLFITFSLFLIPTATEAQIRTFDIVKGNGSYEHYDWSNIDYIDVSADNSVSIVTNEKKITYDKNISGIGFNCQPGEVTASPVGVWEIVSYRAISDNSTDIEYQGISDILPGDRLQICSNGRIYDKFGEVAVWRKGGPYALSDSEAWLVYFTLNIYELSETRFVFDMSIKGMTISMELKRLTHEDITDNPYTFDIPDNPTPLEKDYSYFAPFLDFNMTSGDVKTYMENNNWVKTENSLELLLTYQDPTESKIVEYLFRNDDNKIVFADVTYSTYSDKLLDKLITKIKENYDIELTASANIYRGTYSSFITYEYKGNCDLGDSNSIDILLSTSKNNNINISYLFLRK